MLSRTGAEPDAGRSAPAPASPPPPTPTPTPAPTPTTPTTTPAPAPAPAPDASAAAARSTLPAGSSKEQYAYAFSLMQKASYAEATAAFSDFLQRNPNDSLADNARYWLGESYYARSDYPRAAETFLDAYEKNKTGPKAPDTLLKLGMALGKLDKKKEACASFRELSRSFPNATAQIKDKAAQESQRIGCS
ncbi:tol-pal system protein YbgF [Defluviicoccus vanus]|uniref:tol-pal system protein YbgF n=1 Tax=Defluviicoccus vanus TaxID=111831 RepID=UPI001CBA605C|nr:tol-pal system protein YbgF [Defluviicoccus vanus]